MGAASAHDVVSGLGSYLAGSFDDWVGLISCREF